MPTPENPPIAPSWVHCEWIGPLNASWDISHWDWPTLPFGSPSCPPTIGGVPVPGREGFTQKCGSGAGTTCWDPDLVDQRYEALTNGYDGYDVDTSVQPYPPCSRGWDTGHCGALGSLWHDFWFFTGECAVCPEGYTLNSSDCLCYDGDPCPEGTCYCEETGECVPCSNPIADCEGLTDCLWDPALCNWDCLGAECEPGEVYDYELCECVPRCTEEGECWCEETGECVDCTYTPEPGEHDCEWNTETCDWDCEECPEGQVWCETTGECVTPPDPPLCFEQLNCRWDQELCDWDCDDTATKCGPHRAWLGYPDCRCEGSGGVCNLHSRKGHYHVADDLDGIRHRRSDDVVPPFVSDVAVTSDVGDRSPHLAEDETGRIFLVWLRGTNALEAYTDDEGDTWSEETTIFTDATQVRNLHDRATGLYLRAALVGGELVVVREYAGEIGPEIPTGVMLDDAAFSLSFAPEGPRRILLHAVKDGAAVDYASPDDGATWELL